MIAFVTCVHITLSSTSEITGVGPAILLIAKITLCVTGCADGFALATIKSLFNTCSSVGFKRCGTPMNFWLHMWIALLESELSQ